MHRADRRSRQIGPTSGRNFLRGAALGGGPHTDERAPSYSQERLQIYTGLLGLNIACTVTGGRPAGRVLGSIRPRNLQMDGVGWPRYIHRTTDDQPTDRSVRHTSDVHGCGGESLTEGHVGRRLYVRRRQYGVGKFETTQAAMGVYSWKSGGGRR